MAVHRGGRYPRCAAAAACSPNVILFGRRCRSVCCGPPSVSAHLRRDADRRVIAGGCPRIGPADHCKAHGAQLIVVNYDETFVDDDAAVVIHDDVATVLPRLVEALEGDG